MQKLVAPIVHEIIQLGKGWDLVRFYLEDTFIGEHPVHHSIEAIHESELYSGWRKMVMDGIDSWGTAFKLPSQFRNALSKLAREYRANIDEAHLSFHFENLDSGFTWALTNCSHAEQAQLELYAPDDLLVNANDQPCPWHYYT